MKTTILFVFFLQMHLFSQKLCDDISSISIDSLDHLSSNSAIEYFKIKEDSLYDTFTFKGGFHMVNLYFDSCDAVNVLSFDSNGIVIPSEQMINAGICFCKSCLKQYSKISLKKPVFVQIIKPVKVEIVKHRKKSLKNLSWYEKNLRPGDRIRLEKILFVGGEARFRPISYKDLNRLYFVLAENSHLKIEIQGHVNSPRKRNSKKNQNLSEARAKAVRSYLISKGIKPNRIKSLGFGNTQMIYPETKSEYEMQFNRRVEILIQ